MITYCTGSARQKREYFKEASGTVQLDNLEVLFCASENGRNYFALGDVPFKDFTVEEYLNYRRALCSEKCDRTTIAAFGLIPRKKLGALCAAEMRCVQFLEKTAGHTDKAVVINLDGTRYSLKNRIALERLIRRISDGGASEIYVCVTDDIFLRRMPASAKKLAFGKPVRKIRPRFYTAKRLAKAIGAKRVAVM